MKAVHLWDGDILFCVAFFWRADEARLTQNTVNRLQTAAFTVLDSCEAAQPLLPVDLSAFAICLRRGAIAQGDAPRGFVAVDVEVAWPSDPVGHMFRFRRPLPGSGEGLAVYWLPGRIDGQ